MSVKGQVEALEATNSVKYHNLYLCKIIFFVIFYNKQWKLESD